jgi:hypothetical protein
MGQARMRHRCAPGAETPGDFGFGNTGTIQLPNLGGLKARSHRPAQLFTVLPGVRQGLFYRHFERSDPHGRSRSFPAMQGL